jgi:SAM-dependent methyltransferase
MPKLNHKMLRKVYITLKGQGVSGLLALGFRYFIPRHLACYERCMPFFQGKIGLEIGGPSGKFKWNGLLPIYTVADQIDNCNFSNNTTWEGCIKEGATFHYAKRRMPGNQYVAEATNLSNINSATYDFVLSSHTLEHIANPLQALSEWTRVLKEKGLLVLVIPHKDGTFDHKRPVTSLAHLIQDFEHQVTEADLAHLEEILRLHDLRVDTGEGDFESFKQRSKKNLENRCLHHHVFNTSLAVEVIQHIGLQILSVEAIKPNDIFIVAQKPARGQKVRNERFSDIATTSCWLSPFPSDQRSCTKCNN